MLLLNSTDLVGLHLTIKGVYFDYEYESMLWETISYLKTGFVLHPSDTREEFFDQYAYPHIATVKIYEALIPELHQVGKLSKKYLSYSLDLIYDHREEIDSAIDDYYYEVLNDSIGKYGDWESIGHSKGRSMEWCKRNYAKELIDQYEVFLKSWDNLAIAKKNDVMDELLNEMMNDIEKLNKK